MELKNIDKLLSKMNAGGVFLTAGKKPNTMVIGWGSIGYYWGEPVFIAPVRVSRYTRELIDAAQEFCVSVPAESMLQALKVCGTKSGRDTDKYAEGGIRPVPCKSIATSAIEGAALTIECKVVGEMEMDADTVTADLDERWYGEGNYHIMYYGKIVNIY